jgi:hypothetical protein
MVRLIERLLLLTCIYACAAGLAFAGVVLLE